VLTSSKVKAFMSHCTLEAVSEALWAGLPIVGIPLRGNQPGTCVLAQNMGAACCTYFRQLSSGDKEKLLQHLAHHILRELQKVLVDADSAAIYRLQALRAQQVMQFGGGVQRAADLVEVGLFGGLELLQKPHDRLGLGGWMTGSMVDVRLGVFLITILGYSMFILIIRWTRRLFRYVLRGRKPRPPLSDRRTTTPSVREGFPPLPPKSNGKKDD